MPRAFVLQFLLGASYPLRALGFLLQHRLWPLALWAVGVNVLLLFCCIAAGWRWVLPQIALWAVRAVAAVPALRTLGPTTSDAAVVSPLTEAVVRYSVWILCLPLWLWACSLVVLAIGQLVASPVLDRLSERCEAIVLGERTPPWRWRGAVDATLLAFGDMFWGLASGLVQALPRLALAFVPGVGALVLWGMGASLVAHEFVGLPLTRQLLPYRRRWQAVMAQPGFCLGFGASAYGLLVVPGLNLMVLPLACVGGTLLYCDLAQSGRMPHTDRAGAGLNGGAGT